MRVDAFDFELPKELIAARPVRPREAARLLEVSERLADRHVRDLPRLLRAGDALVLNDTRVIPARLAGRRGAARVEVTLIKRREDASWEAFARPARKLRPGDRLAIADGFGAEVTGKGEEGEVRLRFKLSGEELRAALERYGRAPLPPYIPRKGGPDAKDREDYQTVFAAKEGAVAAPTAGLHFGEALFAALERCGVERVFVTLHVGAGTFLPVRVADTRDHRMRSEWGSISPAAAQALNRVKAEGGRLVAVGTTSLRLLESVADAKGRVRPFEGEVDLFVTPGYRFKAVDLLLTNFHLPRSTLFMLVAAFSGLKRMKAAYAYAMEKGYRFYSYGDCTLLHRADRV